MEWDNRLPTTAAQHGRPPNQVQCNLREWKSMNEIKYSDKSKTSHVQHSFLSETKIK